MMEYIWRFRISLTPEQEEEWKGENLHRILTRDDISLLGVNIGYENSI